MPCKIQAPGTKGTMLLVVICMCYVLDLRSNKQHKH